MRQGCSYIQAILRHEECFFSQETTLKYNNFGDQVGFKGLVHPKMKIKSLITHPHAVPTPVRPLLVFGTQMKIFLIQFERWIPTT